MPAPTLLILPGDGIGPEVMAEVRKVIAWFARNGRPFEIEEELVGGSSYDAHGVAISDHEVLVVTIAPEPPAGP